MASRVALNAWIILTSSMLVGTGTASPGSNYFTGVIVAFLGTSLTIGTVYLCYRYATWLLNRLGDIGTMVMMRLMSFILICIGLQMMWTGWAELNAIPAASQPT